MGISKKELFFDYYMDEIGEIIYEHNEMHKAPDKDEIIEYADGNSFFGF